MRALQREVQDAVYSAIEGYLPQQLDTHPLGCHRRRVPDRVCFFGILIRLVTGAAWTTVEALLDYRVSDTTLRARRDEWINAGVFDAIAAEALAAYDRIIGLDLGDVCIDGSAQRAPGGGEGTGVGPRDNGKVGWKWLIAVDATGIPLDWVTAGANRNDYRLLDPLLQQLDHAGITTDIGTLHLDRGFGYPSIDAKVAAHGITDLNVIMRRQPHQGPIPLVGLGQRWIVEAANSWLTNYGQLRRSTDRHTKHRHAALCLATTILITTRLIDWHHQQPPIR